MTLNYHHTKLVAPENNPFDGMVKAASTSHGPVSEALSNLFVGTLMRSFLDKSLIFPSASLPNATMRDLLLNEMHGAFSLQNEFYLIPDDGSDVQIHRAGSPILSEMVAAFDTNVNDRMSKDQSKPLYGNHLDTLEKILHLDPASVLIELGVGGDYQRIEKLFSLTQKVRGEFICNDIPPLAAKRSLNNIPSNIPFITLPPEVEFLGALLSKIKDVESPKVLSLKNVLSVCSLTALPQLFTNADLGGVDRILFQQSVITAMQSAILPQSLMPAKRKAIFDEICTNVLNSAGLTDIRNPLCSLVITKANHLIGSILLELSIRTALEHGDNHGYHHSKVYFLTERGKISPEEILTHFGRTFFEAADSGEIASIHSGPMNTFVEWNNSPHAAPIDLFDSQIIVELSRTPIRPSFSSSDPKVRPVDLKSEPLIKNHRADISNEYLMLSMGIPASLRSDEVITYAANLGRVIANIFFNVCADKALVPAGYEDKMTMLQSALIRDKQFLQSYL